MGHDERIAEILSLLALARAIPGEQSLSAMITSAIGAVTASARRAASAERHMASAARVSVASGVLYCVTSAARQETVDTRIAAALRQAAVLAGEYVTASPPSDPPAAHDEEPPAGWQRGFSGEFLRIMGGNRTMRILRRPKFPGGEWAVFWGAAAIGSATTPGETAEMAESFDAFMEAVAA